MGKDILVNNGVDYVYFMRLGEAGPIKIGHSVNIKERLAVIQVNNPYLITLLAVVDGGFSKERELHKLFKDHKIYGEWFYPHTDILNYINNLPYLGWISEDLRYHVKKGSEHANWKGDAASLSSKRQRLKAHLRHKKNNICERCGHGGRLDCVFRDGNIDNSSSDNVQLLCRRCRMELDGTLDNLLKQPKRPLVPAQPCIICYKYYKPLRNGRCHACCEYFRRNGIERSEMRKREQKSPAPCIICNRVSNLVHGRCHACYEYLRLNKKERSYLLRKIQVESHS